jgi:hypothetical protein
MGTAPIPYAVPGDLTQWAQDLEALGGYPASDTPALIAWGLSESPDAAQGGNKGFIDYGNVLGATLPEPGSHGTNSANVQDYLGPGMTPAQAWSEGLGATVSEINQSNFTNIRNALQGGTNAQGLANAVQAGPNGEAAWGTSPSAIIANAGGTGGAAGPTSPGSASTDGTGSAAAAPAGNVTLPGFGGFLQEFNHIMNPPGIGIIDLIEPQDIVTAIEGIVVRALLTVGFAGLTYLGFKTITSSGDRGGGFINRSVRTGSDAARAVTSVRRENRLQSASSGSLSSGSSASEPAKDTYDGGEPYRQPYTRTEGDSTTHRSKGGGLVPSMAVPMGAATGAAEDIAAGTLLV